MSGLPPELAFADSGIGNPYKDLRYLVIEDQAASRQTLRMCIQSMGGFSVDMAQSYGEAMTRLRLRLPDVIICDYQLGSGRTGQQLLEEMRRTEALPDAAIYIMVTAERAYEQVISAVELVPDDYIIKPFAPELLRLRLERVIQKKKAFSRYYAAKAAKDWEGALAELNAMAAQPAHALYRFDILRSRAETFVAAARYDEAIAAYEAIIAEYPFPWAKAGLARMLQRNNRLEEALLLVDEVIAQVPRYFEAYDLRASICSDMGDYAAAQRTLAEAAAMTPRNWNRKRVLSITAARAGDLDTAQRVMTEVVENDDLGTSTVESLLDLVRCAMEAGDQGKAATLLGTVNATVLAKAPEESRMSIECLRAVVEGEAGETRFDRLRTQAVRHNYEDVHTAIDVIHAALTFSDRQLADMTAEKILMGRDARKGFHELLALYRRFGLERPFRELQRDVAARRLSHRRAAA